MGQLDGNAIVYCEGAFNTPNGKTAHGLVRFTKRYQVLSVVDSRYAGQDAGFILDGKTNGIPVTASVEEAVTLSGKSGQAATHLVVGLAPDGGRFSAKARADIQQAISRKLNIVCGLHDYLTEDPVMVELAKTHGVTLSDIRKPPPIEKLHFFTGRIEQVDSFKVAVLGVDSAVGKRTTAWKVVDGLNEMGRTVEMVGTGQTAWLQGVRYGFLLDSIINDFLTGEIEHAVWTAWNEQHPDYLILEGQGSLLNPAYPGGYELIAAARPDAVVLQHVPMRTEYDGFPGYKIQALSKQIAAIEMISDKKVIAIAINHENISPEKIGEVCESVERDSGLPTADVLTQGADRIVKAVIEAEGKLKKKMIPENKVVDELNKLLVIDRLDVGPVRVEPKRSVTPYTVTRGDHRESFEFIYTFEEPVFVPGDPASENLAAMMGAQIALNYGLFCREIFFHDALDSADRSFIAEMAKNTAREIYVKKFLEPNPFLRGEAAHLPVIHRKSYLQSELVFPNRRNTALDASATKWITFPKRHAILSSGGKDSLLTYGLMREMQEEIHPIYVNESGRHWFTALNAYRHYAEHIPGTARVWTNSDRVFNWMLRQLPFIRKDFAEVRADDYPIRLWTVAVFLFGALPLLKKRGIGRLLIGDEFDTTERRSHDGIPHYHGLFDQSRFFDEALTRYFKRKQWGISQFSILRPCSEFLIQKILTQRYPDLWQHQVSCHAAHKDGDRVYPCGKCEKCRRIVSMLTALNEDPTVCGYTHTQVEPCLKSFAARGIHQESVGAEHIAHLLSSAGKLEVNDRTIRPKEHPEFMKLRFERERSPFAAIPDDLRIPLYKILLQHADGAVKRSGRNWIEMNPLTDPEAMALYRAEILDEDLQRESASAV